MQDNQQETAEPQLSGVAKALASAQQRGLRNTVRQLGAIAAITWGTRAVINQAGEATEAARAAEDRLAAIVSEIEIVEKRLAQLRDAESEAQQDGVMELARRWVADGTLDEHVIDRYAVISADTEPVNKPAD